MNAGDRCMNWALAKNRMEKLGIHASETAWVGTKFDAVLTNDGTIDELMTKVKDLVQGHLVSSELLLEIEPADSLHIPS